MAHAGWALVAAASQWGPDVPLRDLSEAQLRMPGAHPFTEDASCEAQGLSSELSSDAHFDLFGTSS